MVDCEKYVGVAPPVRAYEPPVLVSLRPMVRSPSREGQDCALDRVVVEFDTAVMEKSGEDWSARERIMNDLGKGPAGSRRCV